MTEQEYEKLRYPIGKFSKPSIITPDILEKIISDIDTFPSRLKNETMHLSDEQLDTPYRPDGWTIRQVVHHCADSHMNAYIRLKLALTEVRPTIKTYEENLWAQLNDSFKMPVSVSLHILEGLHARWVFLLKSLSDTDIKRTFYHPVQGRDVVLEDNIALYAWHCNHHLVHITTLKQNRGWK